ncbi:MAG: hypothetical protein ACT4PZ_00905 [Panacagrimonas sp.]
MTPSIPYRIDSLIQAMCDIVLPAMEADKSLAREQAQLIVAHLHLLKRQLPQAEAFDQLELQAAASLARQLLELESDNTALNACRQALDSTLIEPTRHANAQDAIRQIDGAVENFVRALRVHAARPAIDAMTTMVLAHARERSLRNRIWFSSNGFDSERDGLPGFDTLFATDHPERPSC